MGLLDREEYIEQVYFFQTFRDRLKAGIATQEILEKLDQEILSTTKLPLAIQFLCTEVKHSGYLASGFECLPHYFTPFQAFIIRSTEMVKLKFNMDLGMQILEKQAQFLAKEPSQAGLFVFQFETISRNRLGYVEGLQAMAKDRFFSANWSEFIEFTSRHIGEVEFAQLVFLRSEYYVQTQRRENPKYEPPLAPLFFEKEGKIARANLGKDPFFLFAALQRQLNYPLVPRHIPSDTQEKELLQVNQNKLKDLEMRIKLLEAEMRGNIDLQEFGKPLLLEPEFKDEPGLAN
ncbi:MAG: hypothetical protein EXR99_14860 [Gemmataceae bacterium]|nr:hypothetical protein [Gemmataceae bacterium]